MRHSARNFLSPAPRGAKGTPAERGKPCFSGGAVKMAMATGIVVPALAADAGTDSEEVV